jgi:hypothetical protein
MTAMDWGWTIEETPARLMEVSAKPKENGERYASLTAQNAAAAVERNGPWLLRLGLYFMHRLPRIEP